MSILLLISALCVSAGDTIEDPYPPPATVAPYPAPLEPTPAEMTLPTATPEPTMIGCAPECELGGPTSIDVEDIEARSGAAILVTVLTILLTAGFVVGVFFLVPRKGDE